MKIKPIWKIKLPEFSGNKGIFFQNFFWGLEDVTESFLWLFPGRKLWHRFWEWATCWCATYALSLRKETMENLREAQAQIEAGQVVPLEELTNKWRDEWFREKIAMVGEIVDLYIEFSGETMPSFDRRVIFHQRVIDIIDKYMERGKEENDD